MQNWNKDKSPYGNIINYVIDRTNFINKNIDIKSDEYKNRLNELDELMEWVRENE